MELRAGYKKTEVGIIPFDWEIRTINDAFDICNNLRLPISEDIRKTMQGEYPYYGPTKIQDYLNEFRVEGEYALIGEDGDHFLKWNEISMTQITSGKFNVNNHAHLVKGKKNISTTKWFYYFFKNRDITNHLTRQGAGRYKLSKSTLVKIPCAIPPSIIEQNAITSTLFDVDALIGSIEKIIAKKRKIKQGAMQKLLKPKEGWEVKKLREICELKNGFAFQSDTYDDKGEYFIITIANVQDGFMQTNYCNKICNIPVDLQEFQKLLNGDILISMTGNVGRICRVNIKNGLLNQRVGKIKVKNIDDNFLFHLLSDKLFLSAMILNAQGGAQGNIGKNDILDYEAFIPSNKDEQILIATILTDMNNEISSLETKLAKYKKVKLGMMQTLLTGKIRLV